MMHIMYLVLYVTPYRNYDSKKNVNEFDLHAGTSRPSYYYYPLQLLQLCYIFSTLLVLTVCHWNKSAGSTVHYLAIH